MSTLVARTILIKNKLVNYKFCLNNLQYLTTIMFISVDLKIFKKISRVVFLEKLLEISLALHAFVPPPVGICRLFAIYILEKTSEQKTYVYWLKR